MKKHLEELKEIKNNLMLGKGYGKQYNNVKYPYFHYNLYLSEDYKYIMWSNYGSSAVRNNLKALYWLITTIFEMTPTEFIQAYELR